MPNRNGQGPMGAGAKTGRGRGVCNRNKQPGMLNQEASQDQAAVEPQRPDQGCRGPQGCGTGRGRRGATGGSGRGQR